MAAWWEGVASDFSDLPDPGPALQLIVRLLTAALLGGALGFEREQMGKQAGLRTHMLVALGAALFVVVPLQAGMPKADVSRVIQGLVTGVGFIGAGAIIQTQGHVRGITTAASVWVAAAVGVAAGMGRQLTALLATALALVILSLLLRVERRIAPPARAGADRGEEKVPRRKRGRRGGER